MKNRFAMLALMAPMMATSVLAAPVKPVKKVPPEIPIQLISAVAPPPRAALERMPRGAKSCFYGWFKLSAETPVLWVHLFNPNPAQVHKTYFGTYHLVLHIFEPDSQPDAAKGSLRLLREVAVDYRAQIGRPVRFVGQQLWLDPNQRQKPILKFDCFDPDGIYGAIGDQVLVVFPKGLKQPAIIQSLSFGLWHASDSSGQTTLYNRIDERGLLGLQTMLYPASDAPPTVWNLRWNGQQFYAIGGPIKDAGIEPGLPYP